MDDQKFDSARLVHFGISKLDWPTIETVGNNYLSNTYRITEPIDWITGTVGLVGIYQSACAKAIFEYTSGRTCELTEEEGNNKEIMAAVQKRIHEITDEVFASMDRDERHRQFEEEKWEKNLSFILGWHRKGLSETAIQKIFHSMLISAWTAIEVMLGDLWEAALNLRPVGLASLRGSSNGNKTSNRAKGQPDGKWISQQDLEDNGFDLSGKMGTLLRRDFGFINLEGSIAAYQKAFSCDSDHVLGAIQNPILKALFAIRNVLVHKAGIVDKIFRDDADGIDVLKKWSSQKDGTLIEFDGEDIKALIEPATKLGAYLIVAVDDWITNHP